MTEKEHLILIVPLGSVDTGTLTALGPALKDVFYLQIKTGSMLKIPVEAYNVGRRQYNASAILDMLKPLKPPDGCKMLAVIDKDLYVPGLNFVFGLADMANGLAVISLCRLRNEFYGYQPDSELFFERTLKEAVHELGHTFGRGHCTDPRCVMHFSNRLEDTDRKGSSFCPNCRDSTEKL